MYLRIFFILFILSFLSYSTPVHAATKYRKCEIAWGSLTGAPETVVDVLKRYAAKTSQAFMSRLPLSSMSLQMGPSRKYRCDDAYDDLEARLSRQLGIYLDAHSGFIILVASRTQADTVDRHWDWQWQQGVIKSESELPMSCFTGGGMAMKNAVIDHVQYHEIVSKKLKRPVSFPDEAHDLSSVPLTVLMTKSVCKKAVWNGYVLGLNLSGWRVIPEGRDAYRAVRGK